MGIFCVIGLYGLNVDWFEFFLVLFWFINLFLMIEENWVIIILIK